MSTAAKEEGSAAMVMELWREASVQIDDRCRMIRLNIKTVDRLGHRGENYFVYHCSLLLGKPAEFIFDNSNMERVYLGNPEDMQKALNSVVVRHPDNRFPILYLRDPSKQPQDTKTP
ncbi:hypothetical protein F4824DRAFT_511137 [Ustulina deusta]|nr:hypothetical protein F4823DRAFT_562217 [Ustulina deusta]KAI3335495.1 hypothetical protein F4824DRAFT_511137 [Ustulina deusta]